MRVRIGANSTMDVPHLACAGRFFPTKGLREVEVLDQDEDPPQVVSKRPNPTTGIIQEIHLANQDVMGRNSYRAIIEDGRFSVIETASADSEMHRAQVGAARAEVQRVSAAHADAQVQIAGLTATVADLRTKLDAAEFRIAELEEQLAAATAKKGKAKAKDGQADDQGQASEGEAAAK